MTWASYDGNHVSIRQGKTQTALQLKVHANLKVYLDGLPREALLLVPSPNGTRWDGNAFSKAFKAELKKMGLPHLTFHGLRHTAGRMLAEAGCSELEIASITGHRSLAMVAHYTRQASQRKLSEAAITRLERKQESGA
jgi:integrase